MKEATIHGLQRELSALQNQLTPCAPQPPPPGACPTCRPFHTAVIVPPSPPSPERGAACCACRAHTAGTAAHAQATHSAAAAGPPSHTLSPLTHSAPLDSSPPDGLGRYGSASWGLGEADGKLPDTPTTSSAVSASASAERISPTASACSAESAGRSGACERAAGPGHSHTLLSRPLLEVGKSGALRGSGGWLGEEAHSVGGWLNRPSALFSTLSTLSKIECGRLLRRVPMRLAGPTLCGYAAGESSALDLSEFSVSTAAAQSPAHIRQMRRHVTRRRPPLACISFCTHRSSGLRPFAIPRCYDERAFGFQAGQPQESRPMHDDTAPIDVRISPRSPRSGSGPSGRSRCSFVARPACGRVRVRAHVRRLLSRSSGNGWYSLN